MVDAGSISSSVRIKLAELSADISSCKTAFDNLGTEWTTLADKYSKGGAGKYKKALQDISKESKNVEGAMKAGAISEEQAIGRLIELRRRELQILQDKAVKEGTASGETVAAIQKTETAITKLTEKQKLLKGQTDSASSAFQKLNNVAGALGVGLSIGAVITYLKGTVTEAAAAQRSFDLLDRALELRGMQSAKKGLSDLAEQLQKIAGLDADVTRTIEAELVAQGRSEAQIKQLIKASAGLSAVTGDDLSTSMDQLNKTLDGMPPRMGVLKTITDGMTEAQLRNGEAVAKALKQYEGFIGQSGKLDIELKKMTASMGDLNEVVGGEAGKGIQKASPLVIEFSESIQRLVPNLTAAYDGLVNLKGAWSLLGFILTPISAAIHSFGSAFQVILSLIRGDFPGALNRLGKTALDLIEGLITPTQNFVNFLIGGVNKGIEGINKLRAAAGQKPIKLVEQFDFFGLTKGIDDLQAKLDASYEVIRAGGSELVKASEEYQKAIDGIDVAEANNSKTHKQAIDAKIAATSKYIKELEAIKDRTWQADKELEDARDTLAALNKESAQAGVGEGDGGFEGLSEGAIAYAEAIRKAGQAETDYKSILEKKISLTKERIAQAREENESTVELYAALGRYEAQLASFQAIDKRQADTETLIKTTADYKQKLAELNGEMGDAITIEKNRALSSIEGLKGNAEAYEIAKEAIEKYYAALGESKDIEEFKKNMDKVDKAMAEQIEAQKKDAEELKEALKTIASAVKDLFDSVLDAVENTIQNNADKTIDTLQDAFDAEVELADAAYEAMQKADEEYWSGRRTELEGWYSLQQELIENDGKTKMEALQKELADAIAAGDTEKATELQKQIDLLNLKIEYDQKKKDLDDAARADQERKEQEFNDNKKRRELQLAYDLAMAEYNSALGSWNIKLAQAFADAALSIAEIWGTWGEDPIVAGILTGVSAAATGVQIGIIGSNKPQPPAPPAFAGGGIILPTDGNGGRPAIFGDRGGADIIFGTGAMGQPLMDAFAQRVADKIMMNSTQNNNNISLGPVYASPASYRELNRMLKKYGAVEVKRRGTSGR